MKSHQWLQNSFAFSLLWSKRLEATLYISVVALANDVPVSDRTLNDQIVKNLVIFGSSTL